MLSRLTAVPEALAGYRRTLLESADAGAVSARRQYLEVAAQVRGWTGQTGAGAFFPELVDTAPEGTLRSDLERAAAAAHDSVADFGRFLAEEMAPRGRERDAVGREHYALASRYFLGAEVDLEETYAWGWAELHRIESEMQAIADSFVPGGSIEDAARHLDEDPARHIEGEEEFRHWMQELADLTVDQLAGVHFDIPDPVRRIECCIAPTRDGGVYYTGPSEDFSRPGRMWWSVPEGMQRFSPWREVTTVYHEGVPGHHLQVGQTAYRKDLLNRWQRQMCWVSGSGEGWALYAERLMDELGYLSDPVRPARHARRAGHARGPRDRRHRAAPRAGGPAGATPSTGGPARPGTPSSRFEFMRAHSRIDDATLRFEVNRYLGWPGQAPSYKVGERLWLEARQKVRSRRGAAFDLRTFHREALDLGSIGLAPLTAALERL